jgi:DNA-binding response OmpR family regulator
MVEDNTQIVFYSNLCMEHIAPFRDVLQEYETKTRIPVILIYKGNHSAYPPTSEPLSKREQILADALMCEGYKSLDELIHLFWQEKYGGEEEIIRVMISNMRKKGLRIKCLKGVGYRWTSK